MIAVYLLMTQFHLINQRWGLILVYTALTSFTWPWSDYILPKMLLKEKNLYTVADRPDESG